MVQGSWEGEFKVKNPGNVFLGNVLEIQIGTLVTFFPNSIYVVMSPVLMISYSVASVNDQLLCAAACCSS